MMKRRKLLKSRPAFRNSIISRFLLFLVTTQLVTIVTEQHSKAQGFLLGTASLKRNGSRKGRLLLSSFPGNSLNPSQVIDGIRIGSTSQRQNKQQQSDDSVFTSLSSSISLDTYQHDGYTLTYRYKPAALKNKQTQKQPPLLLIHPVGIGLSSWFWDPIMDTMNNDYDVYAVNLIGCGVNTDGADAWDPTQRGMPIPLGWVKACETLMDQVILPRYNSNVKNGLIFEKLLGQQSKGQAGCCNVVVQGGCAPIGVQLASRNPEKVQHLILTSPPTYDEMVTAVPQSELERNVNFLRNPLWGNLAFSLLETRQAVEFFSNAFLFRDPCDANWLDNCEQEMGPAVRPPVQVFNAGFCQHRSWLEELETLSQPMLVLQGGDDKTRKRKRLEYRERVPNCKIETLDGMNVLPWESPDQVANAIDDFCR